ncbi:hypothetical protein [Kribbella sp. NPDC023855]|uniref:hypothetical protein n=1 Tax=Kribbella sp. NPDC023855 TaxID=3154698 RepID=UPI0034026F56
MRERLNTMPTWALLLITWLLWTVVIFVLCVVAGGSLLWNAVFSLGIGLIVAAGLTFAIKTRLRWENRALGDVPKDARRVALKAAWKGPIPTDPETRAAAIHVAQEQLRQMRRSRPILIIALSLGLVAAVGGAIVDSPWRLLYVLPFAGLLAQFLIAPRRIRRRLALLSESG